MATFQYYAHHPVQRNRLAALTIRDASWTETLNGGSVFSGKVTVPNDAYQIARIEEGTRPDSAAIYVQSAPGVLPWGGVVKKRTWNSDTNELEISVQEWRTWFYSVMLGPKSDGTGINSRTWSNTDQLTIARNIVAALVVDAGIPPISYGAELSGITRTWGIAGTDFKSLGQLLDDLAAQDSGFEWDLECSYGNDNLPQLRFVTYYPQRGGVVPGLLFKEGSNIISRDALEMSSEGRATRVWAYGEGPNAESLPWAMDQDPALADGYTLRTDAAFQFTGATRSVMASYARSQRYYLGQPLGQYSFTVRTGSPDYNSYQVGDRGRIVLRDRFLELDASNARILSKEVSPDDDTVKITVNFNDTVGIEIDPGGVV